MDFLLTLVQAMNWVYISLLYIYGPYGENAAKQITIKAREYGVCVQVYHLVTPEDEANMDRVVQKLLWHKNARVVVAFIGPTSSKNLLASLKKFGQENKFILLGADFTNLVAEGTFKVQPVREMNEVFQKLMDSYLQNVTLDGHQDNKWLRELHAEKFNCSLGRNTEAGCGTQQEVDVEIEATNDPVFVKMHDAVYLFAKAIQKVLNKECKDINLKNREALRSCVSGSNLISNLKFTQHSGAFDIAIDANGDAFAKWDMYQYQSVGGQLQKRKIGIYNELSNPKLIIELNMIDWSVFSNLSQQFLTIGDVNISVPESVCSHPCKAREYFVQQELLCCWECRACNLNEFIVNNTRCVACPFGSWPDDYTATNCVKITKTFLKFNNWITLLITVCSLFGLLATFSVAVFYTKRRDEKIIKATQRELCFVILLGIFIAYLGTLCYVVIPTTWSCLANRHSFNIGVTTIYAPLLVKTVRVYRIFKATHTGIKHMDVKIQLALCLLFILIQVSIAWNSNLFSVVGKS